MTIRTYLFLLLFFACSLVQAQETTSNQSRLILKTHPTKLLGLFRPAIPLSIEWNDGGAYDRKHWGKSIVIRQSYKPQSYNIYSSFFNNKTDYHIYRMEAEIRWTHRSRKKRELFLGVSSFFSRAYFQESDGLFLTQTRTSEEPIIIAFEHADGKLTRHGGFFSFGLISNPKKKAIFEISISAGLQEVGVIYTDIENATALPVNDLISLLISPELKTEEQLWPYFRIDLAIGLNIFKL